MAESGDLEIGSCSIFQTFFLQKFEAPGGGILKTPFLSGKLKNGTRVFFQNLNCSELHVPSIQNELISSEAASDHDLPASAERHLFFYGLDVEIWPKWPPPSC